MVQRVQFIADLNVCLIIVGPNLAFAFLLLTHYVIPYQA